MQRAATVTDATRPRDIPQEEYEARRDALKSRLGDLYPFDGARDVDPDLLKKVVQMHDSGRIIYVSPAHCPPYEMPIHGQSTKVEKRGK